MFGRFQTFPNGATVWGLYGLDNHLLNRLLLKKVLVTQSLLYMQNNINHSLPNSHLEDVKGPEVSLKPFFTAELSVDVANNGFEAMSQYFLIQSVAHPGTHPFQRHLLPRLMHKPEWPGHILLVFWGPVQPHGCVCCNCRSTGSFFHCWSFHHSQSIRLHWCPAGPVDVAQIHYVAELSGRFAMQCLYFLSSHLGDLCSKRCWTPWWFWPDTFILGSRYRGYKVLHPIPVYVYSLVVSVANLVFMGMGCKPDA